MKNSFNKFSRKNFLKKLSLSIPGLSMGGILIGDIAKSDEQNERATSKIEVQDRNMPTSGSISCDLLVYGGTSAGVMAAHTARMYGLNVLLVEPGRHLGGLSSGGLGRTDTGGDDSYISGLSQEFYLRVGNFYGQTDPAYNFAPYVAKLVFERYVDEAHVEVMFSRRVKQVAVQNSSIKSVVLEYSGNGFDNDITVHARNFVDATYEGDLMARAGVSYTIGREGNDVYNEKFNGVIPSRVAGPYFGETQRTREWSVDVDPYVEPGNPDSGLLPEITGIGHEPIGTGDEKVQAYCFRLCLTQNKDNQIPFSRPGGFNRDRYELLARLQKLEPWERLRDGFIISEMPRGKTDVNNYGLVGFSANFVGGNFNYPDADYQERDRIWNEHIEYQKGLWWFLATDERVPKHIREETKSWGYARDEFLDTDGWPHQLYIREARRMVSDKVMTEHECAGTNPVEDGIAMGRYALDSHVVQRVVVDDHVENEGNFFITLPGPYPISYRSIIPKREEITNLVVPICLSASHAAFGSLRMEPVFLALGQAAGVASFLAIDKDKKLHDIAAEDIRNELRNNPLPNRNVPIEYQNAIKYKL